LHLLTKTELLPSNVHLLHASTLNTPPLALCSDTASSAQQVEQVAERQFCDERSRALLLRALDAALQLVLVVVGGAGCGRALQVVSAVPGFAPLLLAAACQRHLHQAEDGLGGGGA